MRNGSVKTLHNTTALQNLCVATGKAQIPVVRKKMQEINDVCVHKAPDTPADHCDQRQHNRYTGRSA